MVEQQQIQDTLLRHDERVRALEVKAGQQEVINQTEGDALGSLVTEVSGLRDDVIAQNVVLTEIKTSVNGFKPNGRRGQIYEKVKVPVEAGVILTLLAVLAERLLGS